MYVPHTPDETKEMLSTIGVSSIDELFDQIPDELRLKRLLDLPAALTELELTAQLKLLAGKNSSCADAVCFMGGGCYDHFVPAVVDTIASRSEYYTAYTPYQAEVSQGTLQVGFEFQSLLCALTGMEVANASLYEGGTAVIEGAMMAASLTGREQILVVDSLHPEHHQILDTYFANLSITRRAIPTQDGVADLNALKKALSDKVAAVVVQSPNFFGFVEPVAPIAELAHEVGALVIQSFDPLSLGLLARPADLGADVAVGEGQSMGTPMSYGGPFLGLFACKTQHVRRIPGRVVGATLDRLGRPCYVLTLQTREQHIRREKATSNICTNQGLLALRASVYLSLLGPEGLREVSNLCWQKAHYAARRLSDLPGVRLLYPGAFFKEFVIELPGRARDYLDAILGQGFHAGVPLDRWYPDRERQLLVAVTEKRTRAEIDAYIDAWKTVLK